MRRAGPPNPPFGPPPRRLFRSERPYADGVLPINSSVLTWSDGRSTVVGMFERFTAEARRAIVQAQEEARRLQHNYIGTEHLLLGLLAEPDGIAARAAGRFGLDLT